MASIKVAACTGPTFTTAWHLIDFITSCHAGNPLGRCFQPKILGLQRWNVSKKKHWNVDENVGLDLPWTGVPQDADRLIQFDEKTIKLKVTFWTKSANVSDVSWLKLKELAGCKKRERKVKNVPEWHKTIRCQLAYWKCILAIGEISFSFSSENLFSFLADRNVRKEAKPPSAGFDSVAGAESTGHRWMVPPRTRRRIGPPSTPNPARSPMDAANPHAPANGHPAAAILEKGRIGGGVRSVGGACGSYITSHPLPCRVFVFFGGGAAGLVDFPSGRVDDLNVRELLASSSPFHSEWKEAERERERIMRFFVAWRINNVKFIFFFKEKS